MSSKNSQLEARIREIAGTCACYKVRQAARAITQLYDDALAPSGLKITQFSLLAALTMAGPAPVGRLADALDLDRTTLTRNVDLLIRDGLAEIVKGEDKRMKLLAITDKGRATLTRAIPCWEEAQGTILNRIGKNNFKDLAQKLSAVTSLSHLG